MMTLPLRPGRWAAGVIATIAAMGLSTPVSAQEGASAQGTAVYEQLKAFSLGGGTVEAAGLVLKRDRVEMSFDGTFYFAPPIAGVVTGAVFVGQGRLRAAVPPNEFEKDNVRRLLGTDVVESDFKTAVLRFTDDTLDTIGRGQREGSAAERAQKLASELNIRILKETGANLAARLALSILNAEKPGFFFAQFDGGKRDRFSVLFDHQNRIPVANFDLNGGEKGLIFSYQAATYSNDIWVAFYSEQDYQRGTVAYSDANDLVDIGHYEMHLDVTDPKSRLRLSTRVSMRPRAPNLRLIPFVIGESLSEYDNRRLKKQMRLKSVGMANKELSAVQEDWEGGLTVFLTDAVPVDREFALDFVFEGDFMDGTEIVNECFYPASNTSWFPRHGYLDRATFDLLFLHRKNRKVASVGERISEGPAPENKEAAITSYRMAFPVALVTFAVGPFERHRQMVKWDRGGEAIPAEFNSLPGSRMAIKEDFILAELDNSLRYFHALFGKYPYPVFGAAFHPYRFGQGFPSLLMIPATDRASKYTYAFVAHETAHQWWGNIVAWRSYRDQWLSEGFAEYSGILYTAFRDGRDSGKDLLRSSRESLSEPPITRQGIGKGKLADVGPIILGHRLNTSKTYGAYQALIYNKGALVLRMLHFLMSNPANGDDKAFFSMMTDFVERHRNGFASTDDFRMVANEHFAKTPLARKYNLVNLNWFFKQWVYESHFPSYTLEYEIRDQPDGSVVVAGQVLQENTNEDFFMPLPIVFSFGDKQFGMGTVLAYGAKRPFEIKLPTRPRKVELDPNQWILSERNSTKGR